MDNEEKKLRTKKQIERDLKDKQLNEVIIQALKVIALIVLFGYMGYSFCLDNDYDILKGIIFGALLPFILKLIRDIIDYSTKKYFGPISYFIFSIIFVSLWIIICEQLPLYIGILAIVIIIVYNVFRVVEVSTRDRTEIVEAIYESEKCEASKKEGNIITTPQKHININNTIYADLDEEEYEVENEHKEDYEIENDYEEEYYCERCLKKISEEEYEMNDCMCEDCYIDVYIWGVDGDDWKL